MKSFAFFICLFLSLKSNADFSLTLSNDALDNGNLSVGPININMCASISPSTLSLMGEGGTPARCIEEKIAGTWKLILIVPIKIEVESDEPIDVLFSLSPSAEQFSDVKIFNLRNQTKGGGVDLLSSQSVMNNQTILGEIELTAIISGPGVKSNYSTTVEISVSPSL